MNATPLVAEMLEITSDYDEMFGYEVEAIEKHRNNYILFAYEREIDDRDRKLDY